MRVACVPVSGASKSARGQGTQTVVLAVMSRGEAIRGLSVVLDYVVNFSYGGNCS